MADARVLPAVHAGDELRRIIAERRRRHSRRSIALLAASVALPLAATLVWTAPALLVWNASASSPVGLYALTPGELKAGDIAIAWPPLPARRLAARRHYLPAGVLLVKNVAAISGARVCAKGNALFVNGRTAALRRRTDRAGRRLPWWSGCRALGEGDLFLLTPGMAEAFDGRYFGITRASEVIGKGTLLWRR